MLNLQALPVMTLDAAIIDIVNDMLDRYYGGTFGIIVPKGATKIAKIYGVDAESVAVECEARFDAAVNNCQTRI